MSIQATIPLPLAARALRTTQGEALRWCRARGVRVDRPSLDLRTVRIDALDFMTALADGNTSSSKEVAA